MWICSSLSTKCGSQTPQLSYCVILETTAVPRQRCKKGKYLLELSIRVLKPEGKPNPVVQCLCRALTMCACLDSSAGRHEQVGGCWLWAAWHIGPGTAYSCPVGQAEPGCPNPKILGLRHFARAAAQSSIFKRRWVRCRPFPCIGLLLAALSSEPQPHGVPPNSAAPQHHASCRLPAGSQGKLGPGALRQHQALSSDACCTVSTVRLSPLWQSSSLEAESWDGSWFTAPDLEKRVYVNKGEVWKKTGGFSDRRVFFRALYRGLSWVAHLDQAEEKKTAPAKGFLHPHTA